MVEELRRLARGIYPAVLADAGLAGALLDLAESSTDLAVRVDGSRSAATRRSIATTGYLIVVAALADARARGRPVPTVCGEERDGTLRLHVADDAPAPRPGSLGLVADADRCALRPVMRPRLFPADARSGWRCRARRDRR